MAHGRGEHRDDGACPGLRGELDRSLRHHATKADLANLKFALAAWMLLLVSAATGIIIAGDRLAAPATGG